MNSSSDANQSSSPPFCLLGAVGYSHSLDTCVLEVVVILFLTVLIIAGNLVVIFVFHCAPLLHHHTTSHFIQTMAYADLLVGVSCLVPSLSLLHYLRGLNEEFTCKAFGYMVSVLKSVSMASLACISVDRYIAITRPLSYATLVTPCRLRVCIVLVWVYSASIFLPSFFGWGKPGYHGDIFQWCADSWKTNPGFSTFIVALLYAPAALTVCFTYGSIFRICRQHTREITQRHARFSSQAEGDKGERGERCEGCPDKRYAMVLFRITSVFYVLWMPYILYFLLESAGLYQHKVASFFTTWLAISNSFCNCLIYSLSNSVFRKGLGRLFSPLFPSCLGCTDAKKPRFPSAPAQPLDAKYDPRRRWIRFGHFGGSALCACALLSAAWHDTGLFGPAVKCVEDLLHGARRGARAEACWSSRRLIFVERGSWVSLLFDSSKDHKRME